MIVAGTLLGSFSAQAHHSFAAEFGINQPVTLKGVLTKMEWVNPHGWIYIDVMQPDGKVVNWAIEAGGQRSCCAAACGRPISPRESRSRSKGSAQEAASQKPNGRSVTMKDGRNFFLGPEPGQAGAPQ